MRLKDRLKRFMVGGAQIGGVDNYLSIGTDGALTDTGTQSHSLEALTVTTLTATNLASSKTRPLFFRPYDFKVSGSITLSTALTTWYGLVFSTACPNSSTDSYIYTDFVVPADVYTSTGLTLYLYRLSTTTAASVIHYIATASYITTGEDVAPVGASSSITKQHTSSACTNTTEKVTIGTLGTGFAAGDLVKLKIGYYSSGASNIATDDTLWMAEIDYASRVSY